MNLYRIKLFILGWFLTASLALADDAVDEFIELSPQAVTLAEQLNRELLPQKNIPIEHLKKAIEEADLNEAKDLYLQEENGKLRKVTALNRGKKIWVDPESWKSLNADDKLLIVFHEYLNLIGLDLSNSQYEYSILAQKNILEKNQAAKKIKSFQEAFANANKDVEFSKLKTQVAWECETVSPFFNTRTKTYITFFRNDGKGVTIAYNSEFGNKRDAKVEVDTISPSFHRFYNEDAGWIFEIMWEHGLAIRMITTDELMVQFVRLDNGKGKVWQSDLNPELNLLWYGRCKPTNQLLQYSPFKL